MGNPIPIRNHFVSWEISARAAFTASRSANTTQHVMHNGGSATTEDDGEKQTGKIKSNLEIFHIYMTDFNRVRPEKKNSTRTFASKNAEGIDGIRLNLHAEVDGNVLGGGRFVLPGVVRDQLAGSLVVDHLLGGVITQSHHDSA